MTKTQYYDLTCRNGHEYRAQLYDSINITLDRTLLRKLFDREINVVECPECHARDFVDRYFVFHDMAKHVMIEVKKGEIERLMHVLDSEGYFDKFKEQKSDFASARP
jgi:hypothetical protein